MALKAKATIKTQLDAVATALTLAYADTVSGVAEPVKDPTHPLRSIEKLLDISAVGVVTINTARWDALWSGADLVFKPAVGAGTIRKSKLA